MDRDRAYDYSVGFDEIELLHGTRAMSNSVEDWRQVKNEPGYEVSSLGRVRSWKPIRNNAKVPDAPRLLGPGIDKDGYSRVVLYQNGKGKKDYRVSALVCAAWNGDRPNGNVVRHLNGIRSDDRPANLAWGTAAQNSKDSKDHGTWIHGEKVNTSRLTKEKVIEIYGMEGTCEEIASKYGVTFSTVSHIKTKRTWKHVTR